MDSARGPEAAGGRSDGLSSGLVQRGSKEEERTRSEERLTQLSLHKKTRRRRAHKNSSISHFSNVSQDDFVINVVLVKNILYVWKEPLNRTWSELVLK